MNPIHVANFTDRDLTKAMASSQTDHINDLAHYRENIIREMREGHQLEGIPLAWQKCFGDIALPFKYISILGGASGNKKKHHRSATPLMGKQRIQSWLCFI